MNSLNIKNQYGEALYRLRIDTHRSRQDVVNHNDISLNALSSIENGQALVKLDTLTMLLNYYAMSLSTFTDRYLTPVTTTEDNFFSSLPIDANFFIFDTRGAVSENKYADEDFKNYQWNAHQFNKVQEGDWFIYRRPKTSKRQFMLFGAGQIEHIAREVDGTCTATLTNTFSFTHYLLGNEDLLNYSWSFKKREREDWQHFFNQYGMTQINRTDFTELVKLGTGNNELLPTSLVAEESAIYNNIQLGNYKLTNRVSLANQRIGQNVLAEIVKNNYDYRCAVTGINTREFLIASHIIPWAKSSNRRLDPSNVICLSPLWDKAFDQGFITIDARTKAIRESPRVRRDSNLRAELDRFAGNTIYLPAVGAPSADALEYHNDVVFKA
ncbi:HNH endonuclease [Lacticaseibacillus songhuajiangensis]|uniref:HNH endonuclease n=1 Tax=Lacticaseibacillus songhuajiangensis TaxID=1296539 RepID=UPI000F79B1D0|nr:HNH endonuclease [Lacticaseibacillus songhuajiangensis]